MTVAKLIEILTDMPDDYELQVEYDFDCDGQEETYYAGVKRVVQQASTGIVFIETGKRKSGRQR